MSVPLLALLAGVLDVEQERITEDSGRDVLPEWTSLAHIQVINAVEDTYGVVLSTREIQQATSVAALRSFLTSRGVPL